MRVSAELGPTLRVLERWILPAECLLCRRPADAVEPDALVCRFCRVRWRRLAPPLCDRCGQPVRLGLSCRICLEWPPALARTRSAVWLDGTAREVVHRLKYDGW